MEPVEAPPQFREKRGLGNRGGSVPMGKAIIRGRETYSKKAGDCGGLLLLWQKGGSMEEHKEKVHSGGFK